MKIPVLLKTLTELETELAQHYRDFADRNQAEHDIYHQCLAFASRCDHRAERIAKHAAQAEDRSNLSPASGRGHVLGRLRPAAVADPFADRGLQLLAGLRSMHAAATQGEITWVMLGQGAQAARDPELLKLFRHCHHESEMEVKWLLTRIKTAAPQALTS
jgi:hypothetical protein